MYSRNFGGMESDGDLYKMEQEAVRRAYEAREKSRAQRPPSAAPQASAPFFAESSPRQAEPSLRPADAERPPERKRNGGILGGLLNNLRFDDILLILLMILLIQEDTDFDLILILGFLLVSGF